VARERLVLWTFLTIVACLCAFALVLPVGGVAAAYAFYVWLSIVNYLLVSQFWSLAADVWSREEGTRLFALIGVGAVSGGIFGSAVVVGFAKTLSGPEMLLLSAALLVLCLVLARFLLGFAARRDTPDRIAPEASAGGRGGDAVTLVWRSPYLRAVAAMTIFWNVVNTNNEWILDKVVSLQRLAEADLGAFYGSFYFAQNALCLGLQLLVTPRLHARAGARIALLVLPVVGLVGGVAFLVLPTLAVVRALKVAENATDYSVQANTRELLYLPVAAIEKYSAKNLNETFVVRLGDSIAAGTIYLATTMLPVPGLVGLNLVLGVLWLLLATRVGRLHRTGMRPAQEP
jgi:AAA family ATP:ADP antiporter